MGIPDPTAVWAIVSYSYDISFIFSSFFCIVIFILFYFIGSNSSGRLSTVSGGSVGETNSVQSEMDDKARSIVSQNIYLLYFYLKNNGLVN